MRRPAVRQRTGAVLRALQVAVTRTQPAVSPRTIGTTTALVMVLCGTYVALAVLVRHGARDGTAPLAVAVSAAAAGLALWPLRDRFRTWHHHLLLPATTLAIGAGVHLDGGGTASTSDAGLFTVMVVVAFYFFTWGTAVAYALLVTAVSAVSLASVPGVSAGDVVVVTCTTATAGVVVGLLSRATASATAAAEVDVLTGLANRRGAERHVTAALADHRGGAPLSLGIVDLDHFKQVNDELGHAAGDDLLRRAAAGWSALLPPGALLGRWGGDEFVLLAPLDPHRAAALVDAMREALPAGRSCTAGVTGTTAGDDLDGALGRADQALYEAKREGRGRTRVWSPPDGRAQPWLDSQPSMRSDSGSSGSSGPDEPSIGASSRSMPTAAI